jgi:hypothetical protein
MSWITVLPRFGDAFGAAACTATVPDQNSLFTAQLLTRGLRSAIPAMRGRVLAGIRLLAFFSKQVGEPRDASWCCDMLWMHSSSAVPHPQCSNLKAMCCPCRQQLNQAVHVVRLSQQQQVAAMCRSKGSCGSSTCGQPGPG